MKLPHSKFIEVWYWGFLCQGAVILGIAPILIPIAVAKSQGPAYVGLVVSGFYLGQLPAPLLGVLADRTKAYSWIYLSGYVLMGAGAGLFPFTNNVVLWFLLAFLQGLSAAASNTVSAMYIVEFRPQEEWDRRIGWLQTFYGVGQALGLYVAAGFHSETTWGMLLAAGLMIPGLLLGRLHLPKIAARVPIESQDVVPHHKCHRRAHTVLSGLHHYQRLTLSHLKQFCARILSRFGLFQLSWFFATFGMWMFMNLYPLLMKESYEIDPGRSALYYAIFATVGAFVYEPSGALGGKIGNARVVFVGILMLLISLVGLGTLNYAGKDIYVWAVPLGFSLIPIAWSPLIVGGTALSGELTTVGQGAGMGIFNANTAIASVAGALAAGAVAQEFGYPWVTMAAAAAVLLGSVLFLPLLLCHKPA